jgi:hypothetical protein
MVGCMQVRLQQRGMHILYIVAVAFVDLVLLCRYAQLQRRCLKQKHSGVSAAQVLLWPAGGSCYFVMITCGHRLTDSEMCAKRCLSAMCITCAVLRSICLLRRW